MERFEILLKKHIDEMGITLYQFAKNTKINRISIQRYVSGQRLPSVEVLEQMLEKMNLSESDHRKLLESYWKQVVGNDVYNRRICVKNILENTLSFHNIENQFPEYDLKPVEYKAPSFTTIDGAMSVVHYLHYALNQILTLDEPELCLFLPPIRHLAEKILPAYKVGKEPVFHKLRVVQLVQMTKKFEENRGKVSNLDTFDSIIRLCFGSGYGYQIYYCSSNVCEAGTGFLYPYYVITNDQLILMSHDMEKAMVVTEQRVIDQYKKAFSEQIARSKPLVTYVDTMEKMMMPWLSQDEEAESRYAVEYQPCFFAWGDPQIIEETLKEDAVRREDLKQLMLMRLGQLKKCGFLYHYFTETGMEEFVECGTSPDYPEAFANPFTLTARLTLLERMQETCRDPESHVRLINGKGLDVQRLVPLYMSENMGVNLVLYEGEMGFRYLITMEQTIYWAFVDFVEHMEEAGMVLSADETAEKIAGYITRIKEKVENSI